MILFMSNSKVDSAILFQFLLFFHLTLNFNTLVSCHLRISFFFNFFPFKLFSHFLFPMFVFFFLVYSSDVKGFQPTDEAPAFFTPVMLNLKQKHYI